MSAATIRAIFAIVLVLCAAALLLAYDAALLSNDTAQYLSVARNLAAGDGAVTDLIYYQPHYDIGGVPVAQTVFPPGYPALIAAVAQFGADARFAAHLCNVLAFVLGAWLLHLILRQRGHTAPVSAIVPLLWLGSGVAWSLVLIAKSDVVLTFVQVVAFYAFVRGTSAARPGGYWLVAAGALAAAAFAVRYQGLFFIAALGSYFLFDAWRTRSWQPIRAAVLFGLVPVIAVAAVSVHNAQLTGYVTGSHISFMHRGASPGVALTALAHEISTLTGFYWSGLRALQWREWLLVLWAIGMLSLVTLAQRRRDANGAPRPVIDSMTWTCSAYIVITCAAVLWFALTRSPGFIQERYLLPLLPFALLLGAEALRALASRIASRRLYLLACAATLAVVAAGQSQVFVGQLDRQVAQNRGRAVSAALATRYAGKDVATFLRERSSRAHPLLATYGQVVGAGLGVPALELTPALFSLATWNEAEVREAMARYGVGYLVFLPRVYRADALQFANQPFLRELRAGTTPAWLSECLRSDEVWLFAVHGTASCQ